MKVHLILSLNKIHSVFNAIFNSMFNSSSPYLNVEASIGSSNPVPGSYIYVSETIETTLSSTASPHHLKNVVVNDATGIEIGDFVRGLGVASGTTVTNMLVQLSHYQIH